MRIVLLMIFLSASQLQAGAWPREKGHAFLSFAGITEQNDNDGRITTYTTFYGEYGLTDKLTIGVDLGGDGEQSSKTIAFIRMPLGNTERQTKFSAELGLGLVDDRAAIRPGVSFGRGITLRQRPGWIAIDSRVILFESFKDVQLETDLTFGLSMTDRIKVIMQVQAGKPAESSGYVRLAPSVVYERKPGRHIELGVSAGFKGSSGLGAKIGTWIEF